MQRPNYPIKEFEYYTYTERGTHGCCSRDYFQTEGTKVLVIERCLRPEKGYLFYNPASGTIAFATPDELTPVKNKAK